MRDSLFSLMDIAGHEVKSLLKSFRLTGAVIAVLALTCPTLFVLTSLQDQEWTAFDQAHSSADSQVEKLFGYARFPLELRIPPPSLSLFNRGVWSNIDPVFRVSRLEPPLALPASANGSWLDFLFPTTDLSFSVLVLFSFIPFLFGYDSICGERRSGTLRLILVNPVSKFILVAGKLTGQFAALLAPLATWWVTCQLWIYSTPSLNQRMGPGDWTAFHCYTLLVVAYAVLMQAVSVLASALASRRSSAIVGLLLYWLAICVLLPAVGFSQAALRVPSQSVSEFDAEKAALEREILSSYLETISKVLDRRVTVPQAVLDSPGMESIQVRRKDEAFGVFRNGEIWLLNTTSETVARFVGALSDLVKRQRRIVARKRRLYEDYLTRMLAQWRLASTVRYLSPAVLFLDVSSEVVGTGPQALENRYLGVAEASQRFYDELSRSEAFNSPLFFLSGDNLEKLRETHLSGLTFLEERVDRPPLLDSEGLLSAVGFLFCATVLAVVAAFSSILRLRL